jgi:hypothetical protein
MFPIPGPDHSVWVRALAVVPVVILVLYSMLLGLLGLVCGPERRKFVLDLSKQVLGTASALMHGPAARALKAGSSSKSRRDGDPAQ